VRLAEAHRNAQWPSKLVPLHRTRGANSGSDGWNQSGLSKFGVVTAQPPARQGTGRGAGRWSAGPRAQGSGSSGEGLAGERRADERDGSEARTAAEEIGEGPGGSLGEPRRAQAQQRPGAQQTRRRRHLAADTQPRPDLVSAQQERQKQG
jgi:hypothetical protein